MNLLKDLFCLGCCVLIAYDLLNEYWIWREKKDLEELRKQYKKKDHHSIAPSKIIEKANLN